MGTIETVLHIDAPPAAVWEALVDFPGWSGWNPVIVGVDGRAGPDEALRLSLAAGPLRAPLDVRITTWDPGRELAWEGGVSGVATACHGYRTLPEGDGTRFEHYEHFGGALVTVGWPLLPLLLKSRYEAVNRALAAEVARRRG